MKLEREGLNMEGSKGTGNGGGEGRGAPAEAYHIGKYRDEASYFVQSFKKEANKNEENKIRNCLRCSSSRRSSQFSTQVLMQFINILHGTFYLKIKSNKMAFIFSAPG